MPDDTEYTSLIERVREKTGNGLMKWEATKDDDMFVSKLDKYVFIIQKSAVETVTSYYLRMYEAEKQVLAVTARRRPAGRIDTNFPVLAELYEMARRRALNVDAKVAEVIGLLDKLK